MFRGRINPSKTQMNEIRFFAFDGGLGNRNHILVANYSVSRSELLLKDNIIVKGQELEILERIGKMLE